MLKIWAKLWNHGRIARHITVEDDHTEYALMDRVDLLMDQIIHQMDLARPIWLKTNHKELMTYGSTNFTQDHFIESFPYQSLEIEIVGTDEDEENA